jgi:hypothetical protein
MDLTQVKTVRIHPAIGIARVGGSDCYFIGPEISDVAGSPGESGAYGRFKDNEGRLKRQAARFRVYGYDERGKVVGEIEAGPSIEITWSVHVANKKAAWYDFGFPLDLFDPNSANWLSQLSPRRNPQYVGAERSSLVIDAGLQRVQSGSRDRVKLKGEFFGIDVLLGEILCEETGRLVFLAGLGNSGTIYENSTPSTFANNPGWYDDIADGPVRATVKIGDLEFNADEAWIVTAPPNFAPHVVAAQTLYDVIVDAYVNLWLPKPKETSFNKNILPIFRRLTCNQWVNRGFFERYGWKSPYDFDDEYMLDRISQPAPKDKKTDLNEELRRDIYHLFRQSGTEPSIEPPFQWPPVYGSASDDFSGKIASNFVYTGTILQYLSDWQAGSFEGDYVRGAKSPSSLEDLEAPDQPDALTRAALDWCIGGPFHPGCELTWIVRRATLYRAPFRIRRYNGGLTSDDYGPSLTPAVALADDGPLAASGPGDLTKWMAVPWQADTASCRAGYKRDVDPFLPTFWPARVPNHAITKATYDKLLNSGNQTDRDAAFRTRARFFRAFEKQPYLDQLKRMITEFNKLAVIDALPYAGSEGSLPATLYVETGYGFDEPASLSGDDSRERYDVSFEERFGHKGIRNR